MKNRTLATMLLAGTGGYLLHKYTPEPDPAPDRQMVPLPILRRRMLYDAGLEQPELAVQMMGMVPLSADGIEREDEASLQRQDTVASLLPLITEQAGWMSGVLTQIHRHAQPDLDDAQLAQMFGTFLSLARATLLGSLSVLTDLGLIQVTTRSSSLVAVDDDVDL